MIIFLVGVSCVGKTEIGGKLAKLIDYSFFDLDHEIEEFFGMAIEHIQEKHLTMRSFRQSASKALLHLLDLKNSQNTVIALPPSGLMDHYWEVVKKSGGTTIVLTDDAANIMKRITFYDNDSNLINKQLSKNEKLYYLSDIKKDIIYYSQSYKRSDISVSIRGLNAKQAAIKVSGMRQLHSQQKSRYKDSTIKTSTNGN